jgi:hypothetical protein
VIGQQVPRGGGGGEILWFHSVTIGGSVLWQRNKLHIICKVVNYFFLNQLELIFLISHKALIKKQ